MNVRNVWGVPTLPCHYVVELENGDLRKFYITPFREITEKDLTQYEGYHPRKCKGSPMMPALFRFYGLEKMGEVLTEVLRVRVSPSQKSKIEEKGSPSDLIREFIDKL